MKTLILSVAAVTLLGGSLSADDKDKADRDRKARVALALAGTGNKLAVATAPAPHAVVPKDYSTGHAKSVADAKPLVVFVGCNRAHMVDGAVVSRADAFGDVVGPAVVIGYPVGDRVMIHATLQCPVTDADLDAAVRAASKKINDPPAKAMPAPKPLDWEIRAAPPAVLPRCSCADSCPCGPIVLARDPRDALVRVRCGDGSGSGTVIWSADGKAVILTAAHVLGRGGDITVRGAGKWHGATVLDRDEGADLAALLVSADLPAVRVSANEPIIGTEVTMLGVTSLWSKGTIATRRDGTYLLDRDPSADYSDSGDSGGGVFVRNELVGVHCGRTGPSRDAVHTPYAAGLAPVRSLLARVFRRDGARFVPVAVVAPVQAAPAKPTAVAPAQAPAAQPQQYAYQFVGRDRYGRAVWSLVPVASGGVSAAPACPNGRCPLK